MSRKFYALIAGTMALLATTIPASAAEKWAVIVGINDYGNNIPHLKFAVADAKRIYGLMTKSTPEDHVVLLTTDGVTTAPTGQNIVQTVSKLAKRAKADDEFWFCFSGHGEDQNGAHYLLPADANVSNLKASAINLKDLRDSLTVSCAAKRKILVVDACHSGWDDLDVGQRGVGTGHATVWASCGAKESSWEIPELGEGVFTWFFLKRQEEIAPNSLTIPNEDDASIINTHVATYIKRNKKPFTQTPQVIGKLPNAGLVQVDPPVDNGNGGHNADLPEPPGDVVAREPLGPVILVDLPEERTQLNGNTIKSKITESALRAALLKQNFPLVDRAGAAQLANMLDRKTAATKAKKLGAAYLIRGKAETSASQMQVTRDFINVQATITAELIDEAGNVLADIVIGGTDDDPVVGTDITEGAAAKVALVQAAQKLTEAITPKLQAIVAKHGGAPSQ